MRHRGAQCQNGTPSTQKIFPLVDGIALDGSETQLVYKFSAEVINDHLGGADLESLLLHSLPVLFLANIGKEAYDLVSFVQ